MIEFLFSQYKNYSYTDISLEIIAVVFWLLIFFYYKKKKLLFFTTRNKSTGIFIYLLWKWELIGDMTINFYYTIMSVYGWYHWTRKKEGKIEFPISWMNQKEKKWAVLLFVFTIIFIIIIYKFFDKFTSWTAYVDTFTTGLFFVGMWLMAKRKIENWIFWIVGDIISIPLYFYKGYTITSIQYFIFTIIAFYGYIEWKKILNSNQQAL